MSETRQRTRLEVDDEQFCKWCGKELSSWMLENEFDPFSDEPRKIELCGSCRYDQMKYGKAKGELQLTERFE